MTFPINLISRVDSHNGEFNRAISLNRPLTVLLGPNGSGKTHLLRGLKQSLGAHVSQKKVRFLSAGRMGPLEQYRSNFDGLRGEPHYDKLHFGDRDAKMRRHQMETLTGDFQTLADRPDIFVKIQERLRKLFRRDLILDWNGGVLKVLFSRMDDATPPYSSGREASGLMQMVGVLSALYDDEVGALLLDEPEVSLHPQFQAFLLNEMLQVAGHPSEGKNRKLVIIATHSAEMIQIRTMSDLLSLVICHDLNTDPIQIDPSAGELLSKKLQSLAARLGHGHKLCLFSRHPILVEGPSDEIICKALATKLELHLEAAGSHLLPVTGKGEMGQVAKLFRLLGKEPIAMTDADGIADGENLMIDFLANSSVADQDARNRGFASAKHVASSVFRDFCHLVEKQWGEIANLAQEHNYWKRRKPEEGDKAKRRAAFCVLASTPASLLPNSDWEDMRVRLQALLRILEKAGLFVLRKGTIESYYQSNDHEDTFGKPLAAVNETEKILASARSTLTTDYADIVRCLAVASEEIEIREVDSLKENLLAVAAPAQARIRDGHSMQDLNMLARSLIGERARLFRISADNQTLRIDLQSKILDVPGFPLAIAHDDDLGKAVARALAVNADQNEQVPLDEKRS